MDKRALRSLQFLAIAGVSLWFLSCVMVILDDPAWILGSGVGLWLNGYAARRIGRFEGIQRQLALAAGAEPAAKAPEMAAAAAIIAE